MNPPVGLATFRRGQRVGAASPLAQASVQDDHDALFLDIAVPAVEPARDAFAKR